MKSEKTPGLYIHIPFCLSKCPYCDFYSVTSVSAISDFLDALSKEMVMYHNRFNLFDPSTAPGPTLQSRDKGALGVNPEPIGLRSGRKEALRLWGGGSRRVDTVYIGGGTPSLLSPEQVERILISTRENFDLTEAPEITIETNPADLSQSFLESMREIGINRIDIGIQSFDGKRSTSWEEGIL